MDAFQKGIELAEENNYQMQLAIMYYFKGSAHMSFLELDIAIELMQKSLEFETSISWKVYPLKDLAYTYRHKGELEIAIEHGLKAFEICQQTNDQRSMPFLLFNLVNLYLDLDNLAEAQKFLDILEQLKKETGYEIVEQLYLLATAKVLRASNQIRDLIKASENLEKLLEKRDFGFHFNATFVLTTIHIKELQLSPSQEALEKVKTQLENLQRIALEKQHFYFLIEIYRLKSQIALIELNAEKAVELLITAKTIAEERVAILQAQGIAKDQEQLNKHLDMWIKLQENNSSLSETIKQVPLDNTINRIMKETLIEERNEDTGKIIEYRKLFALKL